MRIETKFLVVLLYNKLVLQIQDKTKSIGLIFLGKLGDFIYHSNIITIVYVIFILVFSFLFPLFATSSLFIKSGIGVNFVFISYVLILNTFVFELLYSNESSASFFKFVYQYSNKYDLFTIIFLSDLLSIKLLMLIMLFINTLYINTSFVTNGFSDNMFIFSFYAFVYLFTNNIFSIIKIIFYNNYRLEKLNKFIGNVVIVLVILFGASLKDISNDLFVKLSFLLK